MGRFSIGLGCLLLVTLAAGARAGDGPAIAAASDLKFALPEIAARFSAETGTPLRLTFGSSGTLRAQIEQGAGFELFLSADEALIHALHARGLTRGEGVVYGIGQLVFYAPHDSPLRPDPALADLVAATTDGRLRRFAIANPEHAPYGRAAREVLRHLGLWDALRDRLVLGDSAAQAAQFAAGGSTEGGLIPHALAQAPELAARGAHAPVPAAWHAAQPLRQRMALLRGAGPAATAFYRYLQQPAARAILARYGFGLPPDPA